MKFNRSRNDFDNSVCISDDCVTMIFFSNGICAKYNVIYLAVAVFNAFTNKCTLFRSSNITQGSL